MNDNYDYQKTPPSADSANLKAYQDEQHDRTHINNGQLVLQPDSLLDRIEVERDLEDFSPLEVMKVAPMGKGTSKIQYVLYLKGTEGSPSIKVFHAVFPNSNDLSVLPYPAYFNDPAAAAKQLQAQLAGTADAVEYKSHEVTLPAEAFATTSRKVSFMFEGVKEGKGLCTLELRYKGTPLARYSVPIHLQKIGELIEDYSVSQSDDEQTGPPLQTARVEHALPDPTAEQSHDYILWVHGWNWADWQKEDYGHSVFKRLYWLGYKGTFGIFKWPDTYGLSSALTFDESEVHALESGAGLKNLIMNLKGRGFKVNLYAHSQGCMVVSEALRQIALDTTITKPVVDSMTFITGSMFSRPPVWIAWRMVVTCSDVPTRMA